MDNTTRHESLTMPRDSSGPASLTCPEPSCQRTFSRSDHVQRHWISARSHPQPERKLIKRLPDQETRPYACELCEKRFARKDLLRRHLANRAVHGFRDPEAIAKSKRVLRACRRCASKKLKCDGEQPCGRCRKQNQDCEYERGEAQFGSRLSSLTGYPGDEGDEDIAGPSPRPSFGDFDAPALAPTRSDQSSFFRDTRHPSSLASATPTSFASDSHAAASSSYLPDFSDDEMPPGQSLNLGLPDIDDSALDGIDFDSVQMEAFLQDIYQSHIITSEDASIAIPSELHSTFQQSPWQWAPQQPEQLAQEELNGLPGPVLHSYKKLTTKTHFSVATRDKLLGCVMEVLPAHERVEKGVPSLPGVSMLDDMAQFSLLQQSCSTDSWVHRGLFQMEATRFLFSCSLAANGAVHSSVPSVVRFGYALHEVVRKKMTMLWENDSSCSRETGMIRILAMNLQVGMWSGYDRLMEVSEAFLPKMATILRKCAGFHTDPSSCPRISQETTGPELQRQWENFVAAESFKRMGIHLFIQQAQSSMAFHTPVAINLSEMNVQLPYRREIWAANNPMDWRNAWCRLMPNSVSGSSLVLPTVLECIANTSKLMQVSHLVDFPMAALAVLNGYWNLLSQQHELALLSSWAGNDLLAGISTLTSSGGAIAALIQSFKMIVLPAISDVTSDLPLMKLHHATLGIQYYARISSLQTFAGSYGSEASRSVSKELVEWASSSQARSAIQSAALVLQAADEMPRGSLRDFAAIAVYHAALVLWTYGILGQGGRLGHVASQSDYSSSSASRSAVKGSDMAVIIDNDGHEQIHDFIASGIGNPCILSRSFGVSTDDMLLIPLNDPTAIMNTCRTIFEINHRGTGHHGSFPVLVENLMRLIANLGRVASPR